MSLALLYETRTELRRLAIAGGALAAGDIRLKKLLPQLAEAGKAAPVFSRLHGLVEKTANGDTSALLEAGVLINAMLTTQAGAGETGDMTIADKEAAVRPPTQSYRTIAPVLRALTTRGGGRYEIIREALEQNTIADIRLLPALVGALEDSYVDNQPLAAKGLKELGPVCLPYVLAGLDLKKKPGPNVQRLDVAACFLGEKGADLYQRAYDEGAPAIKEKAIGIMADYPVFEQTLVDIATADKIKDDIRTAAIMALGKQPGMAARAALRKLLLTKNYGAVFDSVRKAGLGSFFKAKDILSFIPQLLKNAGQETVTFYSSTPQSGSSTTQFLTVLAGIANTPDKTPEMYEHALNAVVSMLEAPRTIWFGAGNLPKRPFFGKIVLPDPQSSSRDYSRISRLGAAAETLASFDTQQALDDLINRLSHPNVDEDYVLATLNLASALLDPEQFFDLCRPLLPGGRTETSESWLSRLQKKILPSGKQATAESSSFREEHIRGLDAWLGRIRNELYRVYFFRPRWQEKRGLCPSRQMDARWIDGLIAKDSIALFTRVQKDGIWVDDYAPHPIHPLICALARPDNPSIERYLLQKLNETDLASDEMPWTVGGLNLVGRTDVFAGFTDKVEQYLLDFLLQRTEAGKALKRNQFPGKLDEVLAMFPDHSLPMLNRVRDTFLARNTGESYLIEGLIGCVNMEISNMERYA